MRTTEVIVQAMRRRGQAVAAVVAVVLAGCGGMRGDAPSVEPAAGEDPADEDPAGDDTAGDKSASEPTADDDTVAEDALAGLLDGRPPLPDGVVPALGRAEGQECRQVEPDELDQRVLERLAEVLSSDVAVASVVELREGERRGLAVGTYVDGGTGDSLVWSVQDGDLLPLGAGTAVRSEATTPSRGVGDSRPGDGMYAIGQDCSLALAGDVIPKRPEPPAELRDDLLDVQPDPAASGDVVEVSFEESYPRGVAWELVDADGEVAWWMTSDANGGEPVTVPAGSDGYGYEDIGIDGAGPDRVRLDPATEPGAYRLCTANAGDDVCASLTVEASG